MSTTVSKSTTDNKIKPTENGHCPGCANQGAQHWFDRCAIYEGRYRIKWRIDWYGKLPGKLSTEIGRREISIFKYASSIFLYSIKNQSSHYQILWTRCKYQDLTKPSLRVRPVVGSIYGGLKLIIFFQDRHQKVVEDFFIESCKCAFGHSCFWFVGCFEKVSDWSTSELM